MDPESPSTLPCAAGPSPRQSLLGWRLLALAYDFFPAAALWMLVSVGFTLGHTFLGHHDPHQSIRPFSLLAWLLWLSCWVVTGAYATISWRRGGATLGMRPWRLRVVSADGSAATLAALWKRYAFATLSLLPAGIGFWWALVDRERLAWHDRASHTRMLRTAKPAG